MDRTRLATTTAVVVDPNPGDYASLEKPPGSGQLKSVQLSRLVQQRSRPTAGQNRFNIRFVPDGRSALRLSRRTGSAVWMINTQLPDMTGFDLFEMLSAHLVKTPIFLVANEYCPSEERESFRLGASKFLCKPVAPVWLAGLRWLSPRLGAHHEIHIPRAPPPGAPLLIQPSVYYEKQDDT